MSRRILRNPLTMVITIAFNILQACSAAPCGLRVHAAASRAVRVPAALAQAYEKKGIGCAWRFYCLLVLLLLIAGGGLVVV